jgi:hypothetical protein
LISGNSLRALFVISSPSLRVNVFISFNSAQGVHRPHSHVMVIC